MPNALVENATLLERIDVDPTLAIFRIRPDAPPPASEPWFLPGQYVTIGMGTVQRAYSIASDPAERRWLEFYVRYARDPATESPLTHMLWARSVGTRVHLGAKITGRFTLERTSRPDERRLAILVAAGTGLAPFVSMVRRACRLEDRDTLGRLAVLHGVSHPHELAYRDLLEDAASRFGLRYLPTVSRPAGHPDWKGLTGRVETLFETTGEASLERALGLADGGLRPDSALVYVCGFRGTIAETLSRMIGRGFVPEDRRLRRLIGIPDEAPAAMFFEQYDLEPVIDPADTAAIAALRAAYAAST